MTYREGLYMALGLAGADGPGSDVRHVRDQEMISWIVGPHWLMCVIRGGAGNSRKYLYCYFRPGRQGWLACWESVPRETYVQYYAAAPADRKGGEAVAAVERKARPAEGVWIAIACDSADKSVGIYRIAAYAGSAGKPIFSSKFHGQLMAVGSREKAFSELRRCEAAPEKFKAELVGAGKNWLAHMLGDLFALADKSEQDITKTDGPKKSLARCALVDRGEARLNDRTTLYLYKTLLEPSPKLKASIRKALDKQALECL